MTERDKDVIIKRYYLDHVYAHNKVLFNTNNHWSEQKRDRPIDYYDKLYAGNTGNWINLFHKDNYFTIMLDVDDLKWMKKAFVIGTVTKKFSHIYDDELEAICKKYDGIIPADQKYFVRSERVSLKGGMHGPGPYNNIKNVIESMVTCELGHECFNESDVFCTLYFMKWIDMDPDKEFRIFVYNNEITALSSQHLYSVNNWLNSLTDEEIKQQVNKIVHYFNNNIKNKLTFLQSYVMDLALIGEEETPYFIEPNSFGSEYASGSALYHWIYDHDTLYESNILELRYVNEY